MIHRALTAALLSAVSVNGMCFSFGLVHCQANSTSRYGSGGDNSSTCAVSDAGSSSAAWVDARDGVLKGYASANSAVGPQTSSPTAETTLISEFSDLIYIDSPGLDGQMATVRMSLVSYNSSETSTSFKGTATSGFQTYIYTRDYIYGQLWKGVNRSQAISETTGDEGAHREVFMENYGDYPLSLTVELPFGAAFSFHTQMRLAAVVSGNATANEDATRSVYWNGLSVLHNGLPVAFTVSSLSGTDWAKSYAPASAIPEPETFAFLLAGLGMFGIAARKRAITSRTSGRPLKLDTPPSHSQPELHTRPITRGIAQRETSAAGPCHSTP